MVISDYWFEDSRSDLDIAESLLENKDIFYLSEKRIEARSNLENSPTFKSLQVDKYQGMVVAYLEDTEGQKYKIGHLEPAWIGKKLVFDCENPEPIQF